jgi:putative tryptophan/tyrosine transport system substrate-binding protein
MKHQIQFLRRRREFITLLGGTLAWPLAARAQQPPMRHVLMSTGADNPDSQARLAAFLQGLQEFGWAVGRNLRIDVRWGAGDPDRHRQYAAELVSLAPDAILATGSAAAGPLEMHRLVGLPCSNLHGHAIAQ